MDPPWKRQRMDADKGGLGEGMPGGSRQDSIFYKTRMCIKCAGPSPLCMQRPPSSAFLPACGPGRVTLSCSAWSPA
jgi:hypothetical protein